MIVAININKSVNLFYKHRISINIKECYINTWEKILIGNSHKRKIYLKNKHMEKDLSSLLTKRTQILQIESKLFGGQNYFKIRIFHIGKIIVKYCFCILHKVAYLLYQDI